LFEGERVFVRLAAEKKTARQAARKGKAKRAGR
jgi:hypothetical protein